MQCAWRGELPHLPVFGNGNNIVPTIHALDLGAVVLNIADSRPKIRYILAVDESHCSLTELVKTVSACLGTGHTQRVAREEALLNKDVSVSYNYSNCSHALLSLVRYTCSKQSLIN